jgi:hypothetical protein
MVYPYEIEYDEIKSLDNKAALTIVCSNWRNPVIPKDTAGFVL